MMLLTETNKPSVERRIRSAASRVLSIPPRHLDSFFEHGQFWVGDKRTGAQWSVCDANTVLGFWFEQVTIGDGD